MKRWSVLIVLLSSLVAIGFYKPPPETLVEKGRRIFFTETFNGNGRTCGTCHPADNNFTLDPAFIAKLPQKDPLFVAEYVPALAENFENPKLMREFGLILENIDGFDDLANKYAMRGVPQTLALRTTSIRIENGVEVGRLGWSGDGAPGDGKLRSFATGAVIQHFTRTLNRIPGVDFRLPTSDELDALEAFQLSLGRQTDLVLPLPLKGTQAQLGQDFFIASRCNGCHAHAGAGSNNNFDTGIEDQLDRPQDATGEFVPPDDGFGMTPNGTGEFNTAPLVEVADTAPFFHDNSIATLEAAIAFFIGPAFDASPSGPRIEMDGAKVSNVAAFLRVLNVLENIRQSIDLLSVPYNSLAENSRRIIGPFEQAQHEIDDAIRVLEHGNLNYPFAIQYLKQALLWTNLKQSKKAMKWLKKAKGELMEL
jgi:hypothetical protein